MGGGRRSAAYCLHKVHKTQITISRQHLSAKCPNSSAVSACARSFKPDPGLCPCQAISIFKAFCFGSMSTKLNLTSSMMLPTNRAVSPETPRQERCTSAAGASSDKSLQSMPASPDETKKMAFQDRLVHISLEKPFNQLFYLDLMKCDGFWN